VIVLDASALVEFLLGTRAGSRMISVLSDPTIGIHAPHLANLEVIQTLRRYVRLRTISAQTAADAIENLLSLDLQYHSHEPLLWRAWELQENASAYDGVYLALAEALDATLWTCDRRLTRIPGSYARIQLAV
jgi:predicted nucleic acid-binding protein